METPAPSRPAAPAVVAVVVTHNPGPWFETCIGALAQQDYSNLAVLVIDSASDADPTPRVAAALPDAYVRRLDRDAGFGAAANSVTETVDGASFFCFLHDDAAPEPGAIRIMVNEAVRSNAGIVGCKLVQLDDHRRLLQVGESIDKSGERTTRVESGELDQEQHDSVQDVFVVPGACTLVRADLFEAIGRFDEGIDLLNDDLNLCWRAHVAGARVVVAPDAVVGHAEALGERSDPDERRQRLVRHRLRTVLSCYSRWHLVRVLPQAAFVALLEIVYSVLVGRRGQAGDVVRAWTWNWRRRGEIRAWRARIADFRGVPDHEVRRFQVRGSARFSAFIRGQTSRGGSRSDRANAAWRRVRDGFRTGRLRWPLAAWSVTAAIVLVGSRHLLLEPVAVVGRFPAFDQGPRELLDAFLSGWRTTGLGSASPSPTAFGLLSGLGALFLGAMGTLRRMLLLGPLLVGLVGAHRLAKPVGSLRAQAVAVVVYGAIPLGYDAVAAAHWGALVIYATMPWLLAQLARAAGWAPFGAVGGTPGPGVRAHDPVGRAASLALLLAVAGAVEPAVVVVAVVTILALVLAQALLGRVAGLVRLAVGGGAGIIGAIGLHVPWTLDFVLPGSDWSQVVGGSSATPTLADLLRFHVGPVGGGALATFLPIAAALPLLMGREWRFDWAVRAWSLALVPIGLAWAAGRDWLPVDLPRPEIMLAPAAAGFALAMALGVRSFEEDLRAYGFGWRQVASAVAAVAVLVGAFPTMLDAGNGRWYLPSRGLETTFGFFDQEPPGFRVLWIGDAEVLPLPGHRLDGEGLGDLVYATSTDGLPTFTDSWITGHDGPTALLGDAVGLAVDGQTSRLGRLLAPMGVRYVVIPTALAPRPLGGTERAVPEVLTDALADQLDLAAVAVNPAYVVYRNQAALGLPSILAPGAGDRSGIEVRRADLVGASPTLQDRTGPTTSRGDVAAGTRVLLGSSADDGWELVVDGRPAQRVKLFGWAQGFETLTGGTGVVRYQTSLVRYGVLAFQIGFIVFAVRLARRSRRNDVVGLPTLSGPAPAGLTSRPPDASAPDAAAPGETSVLGRDDEPADETPTSQDAP